tara:strand:+ start:265 stop:735 length:471 start_codon:yes stop_codon:yes gene_type:complete
MIYNIHIEISKDSKIKYEFENNKLIVDRFLNVPFVYPFNYGYIPHTLGRDNDPLDAVVVCDYSLLPTSNITCKLIGVLKTKDEKGEDNKFIFIPDETVDIKSKSINSLRDLNKTTITKIKYFFEHYKDLDENKWIEVGDFVSGRRAKQILIDSNIL